MVRKAIQGRRYAGPYSPAIIGEGRFVFVAGQGPLDAGEYRAGTIEEETRLTLENLGTSSRQAGSGFEHVVRCGVWLADLGDFDGMNSVYQTFFPEPRPARATVGAGLIDRQGRDRLHRARALKRSVGRAAPGDVEAGGGREAHLLAREPADQ